MCLAISALALNDLEQDIPKEHIINAWKDNNDGAGFAYVKDGNVVVEKGFMRQKKFLRTLYKRRKQYKDSRFLIHLRWASKGEVNKENTHPFITHDGSVAFVHNGTIGGVGADKDKSDTKIFCEMVSTLPSDFYNYSGYLPLLASFVGPANKVAFLTKDNRSFVLNGDQGIVVDGNWYSNEYYRDDVFRNKFNKMEKVKKVGDGAVQKQIGFHVDAEFCPKCGKELVYVEETEQNKCYECLYEEGYFDDEPLTCRWCDKEINEYNAEEYESGLCSACIELAIQNNVSIGGEDE